MDTTKTFPIDGNLIALNQIRKKIGLQQKIGTDWRSVQYEMYMSHRSVLHLVNEKMEVKKIIAGGGRTVE